MAKTMVGGPLRIPQPGSGFEPKIGASVSNVRLTEPIESGAKLASWRGKREGGSSVIVHVLLPEASKRERDTFVRAGQKILAARTQQFLPGIVPLVEVIPSAAVAIADFDASGTLADLPVLDWEFTRKLALVKRLGLILSSLHGRGIFHGCMRPQNVLLDDQFEPVLSDVGSLVLEDSFPGTADTKHEYWSYAAREVRQGQAPNARADVFALGRLLHFVLVGDEPNEPDENLPKLDALADAPAGLVRIVRRATSRDPAQRHESIDQFIDELGRYTDTNAVGLAHPDGLEGKEKRRDTMTPPVPEGRPSVRGEIPKADPKRSETSRKEPKKSESGKFEAPSKPEAAKKPEGEKARVVPMQVVFSTVKEEESIDPLAGKLGFWVGVAGILVLAAAAGLAFRSGEVTRNFLIVGVAGAVLASAWLPGFSRWYLLRPLWIAACVSLVIFGEPLELAAGAGRQAKFAKGSPAQKGAALVSLASHGRKQFRDLDLTGADFTAQDIPAVDFTGTKLTGAKFERSTLSRVNFSDADIAHADFRGARLDGAQVSASVGWRDSVCDDRTVMPEGWSCVDSNPKSAHDIAGIRSNRP
ncbi:MAG: pentapeptide repeat-containing protein [Deltaproteobacteria bacterium]|nr:pentapeptide repeat-containing protein [Deltaproteobacteria bacterium]